MNLFMVNIYTNILVVLPLRKILQRVDHLVNEIEHAESQSQSSLVFCAFFNSRFFAQMKTIILEFCSLYLILQVRNRPPINQLFFISFLEIKISVFECTSWSETSSISSSQSSLRYVQMWKANPRQLFYVSISRKKSFFFCHQKSFPSYIIYFLLVFDKSIVNR